LPFFVVANEAWAHFSYLELADPNFGKPGPIHVIIGADSYGQILKPELLKSNSSPLIAQSTLFGWVISGPVTSNTDDHNGRVYHCTIDRDLQDLLARFWKQEEIPESNAKGLSNEEDNCEKHFLSTFSRDQSGRYMVRLPLKSPATLLGDSSSTVLRCLSRLNQKFEKQPSFCELYKNFLQEYLTLGHMTPAVEPEVRDNPMVYLPHHGVLRDDSPTTKLRVVFNGSSPTSSGVSLNDILYSGAKLQSDLSDVLLWFRSHKYVFSSDITKMYRQILIHPSDHNLQRIFWYDSQNQLCSYCLTTVTYGLSCAPFLALRVIQQLIIDEGHRFPKAIPSLVRGPYVDDIFGGAESIDETMEIIIQVTQLCNAGGFPLQKWHSNCPDLLVNMSTTQKIAQLYDPLGFMAPIVISAKIFIQSLWLIKIDWDTPLPSNLQDRWYSWKQQLQAIISIQLHGFSDASQLAMAAVVYVRVETPDFEIRVNIVCAKTKVAPLKKLTIPRLELNAALMLSRLMTTVQTALALEDKPIFMWTDSSVVLTWVTSHPAKWKDYVRNRVSTIQDMLPSASWQFVSGKENPADCATRGLSAQDLERHRFWWSGPSWLRQKLINWPKIKSNPSASVNLEESPNQVLVTIPCTKIAPWNLLERYSSYTKLLRITAICKRAADRFRRLSSESIMLPLTPQELLQCRYFWIRQIQKGHFHHDIKILERGGSLPKSSPLIRLTPFIDELGLLRVGGRLQHANLNADAKHPFLLPKQSPLTRLIIADAHLQTLHGGTQITLAHTRQQYWILGGRIPVRSFILKCVTCARYRQTQVKQLMGQLPLSRVTPSRPFSTTGVDYAGPITIKTWRGRAAKTYKGYLAIFVCFSTSAVHIEIVTDYTTEAFIAAYKRFTARRGICTTLQSDNGTNFVGADHELRRRFQSASKELKELASLLADLGTEWRFIPAAAPHFGGKWEAAVKSTKYHLRRMIGDSILTYEELSTLTTQIEAILNSRLLCPLSEDVEDFSVLTPGHFILGDAPNVLPEPNLIDQPNSRLTRWQLIRQKVEHFWKRWKTECLQRYQAILKWHHPSTQLKKGSLVLIADERYPPAKWPLARIQQLHPGEDGLTRVVTLRTATSTLKRPVTKLFLLPVK
ncbi:PREDICTED: uncharacterized protein LOC108769463, partial [Trachymyrmex cornetzi]|uniref:uncharacterized protein LOC108769463 n=1 Tax=Trachymyrmex cornetzi TaxID=471704 RepID=UPI00084F6490